MNQTLRHLCMYIDDIDQPSLDKADIREYTILQPGKNLDLSVLLKAKIFKNKGHKSAAIDAMKKLQETGLGTLKELGSSCGTSMVCLISKMMYTLIYYTYMILNTEISL